MGLTVLPVPPVLPKSSAPALPPTVPPDPRQLSLPLVAPGSGIASPRAIARSDRVFVNRDLRFSNIDWIGFDMDYTLAIYRQERMDTLSVELTHRAHDPARLPRVPEEPRVRHSLSDPRPARRQALRARAEDGPLQGRAARLPRHAPAPARRDHRALSRQAHPPAHAALPLDRHACSR